ncbi:MAG: sigma-54-dependent Fis family transcriptional regulator [Bacteroidaceae bacterium]|nr:sigma-54-dependent Fis family transcriptional regulator [Bacteroidaceae bacterium]
MILVIDDNEAVRTSLSFMLRRAKYEVEVASSPAEAIQVVRAREPHLILMDMNYSLSTDGEEGIMLLRQVKVFCPQVPVILMTAWGSIDLAVKGMQAGAFDFVTKPWNNMALMQRIETALELTRKAPAVSEEKEDTAFDACGIVGRSKALKDILATVERVAKTNASVLITGESGTGKELIAEALHRNSRRNGKPFVKVNLGGISQSLFESEMFGHKRGAFTDASADRVGRFAMADGGTIFLDEIGELDLACQVKLLRVLQDRTFEVLGDSKPRNVDVRVVCATNRNLQQMVREGTFREDLFYRINLIPLHLPPLRERREDIPLLVRHFAASYTSLNSLQPVEFAPDTLGYLASLPFMGNVRELKNLVERTILINGNSRLSPADFEAQYNGDAVCEDEASTQGLTLDEVEKLSIKAAINKYGGNLTQVALALGISRQSLYRRMEKYGLKY